MSDMRTLIFYRNIQLFHTPQDKRLRSLNLQTMIVVIANTLADYTNKRLHCSHSTPRSDPSNYSWLWRSCTGSKFRNIDFACIVQAVPCIYSSPSHCPTACQRHRDNRYMDSATWSRMFALCQCWPRPRWLLRRPQILSMLYCYCLLWPHRSRSCWPLCFERRLMTK